MLSGILVVLPSFSSIQLKPCTRPKMNSDCGAHILWSYRMVSCSPRLLSLLLYNDSVCLCIYNNPEEIVQLSFIFSLVNHCLYVQKNTNTNETANTNEKNASKSLQHHGPTTSPYPSPFKTLTFTSTWTKPTPLLSPLPPLPGTMPLPSASSCLPWV